jgi:Flp pilus assembly protein TadD
MDGLTMMNKLINLISLAAIIVSIGCSSSSKKSAVESEVKEETISSEAKSPASKSGYAALNEAIRSQKLESIRAAAQEVLMQNPNDVKALNALGILSLRQSQTAAAEYFFKKANNLSPNSELNNNLGVVALSEKKTNEAIRYFKKALELSPNDFVASQNLGSLYLQNRDFSRAATVLEPVSAKGKKDFKFLNNLALAYSNIGKEKLAEGLYEEARKLAPQNKEILFNQTILMVDHLGQMQKGQALLAELKSLGIADYMKSRINELENKAKTGVK